MAYDEIFIDGFDKYATMPTPPALADWLTVTRTSSIYTLLSGEWSPSIPTSGGITLGPALGGPAGGYSARLSLGQNGSLYKAFPIGNCARTIGGFAFYTDNFTYDRYYTFIDTSTGSTHQCYFAIMATTGKIGFYRGTPGSGTLLHMSAEAVSLNTVTFIEWDITFHNSAGIAKIYLNGTLTSINLTGIDNCATANNFAGLSGFLMPSANSSLHRFLLDHYYQMYFTASGSGDTALRTNPVVATDFPATDNATQFEYGYTMMGEYQEVTLYTSTAPSEGNITSASLMLMPFVAPVSGNLDNVYFHASTATALNWKPCVYADAGGGPGALLAQGPEVAGTFLGQNVGPLTSPLAVTKGTTYWIGLIHNAAGSGNRFYYRLGNSHAWQKANTYASGPPNPAGSPTNSNYDYMAIYARIVQNAGDKAFSIGPGFPSWNAAFQKYLYDNVSGQKDLFNTTAMSPVPVGVHVVAMKALASKSDGGAVTINLKMKSGATEGDGTKTLINPNMAPTWVNSYFPTDPNTGAAWTGANVSASKIGYAIN